MTNRIQKSLVALAAVVLFGSVMAAPPCERIEYAELKDSSRRDLDDAYCSATRKANSSQRRGAIKQELFESQLALRDTSRASRTLEEKQEFDDAQVACLRVAQSVAKVLEKKFSAKPPKTCNN